MCGGVTGHVEVVPVKDLPRETINDGIRQGQFVTAPDFRVRILINPGKPDSQIKVGLEQSRRGQRFGGALQIAEDTVHNPASPSYGIDRIER